MRRIAALVCTLAALPSPIHAAAEELTFAGLAWGAERQHVTDRLREEGFALRSADEKTIALVGRLHDHQAIVVAWMPNGQLVKITVRLMTPRDRALQVFDTVKRQLAERFGEPVKEVEGAAGPAAFWRRGQSDAYIIISPESTVDVSYESAAWRAEYERLTRR